MDQRRLQLQTLLEETLGSSNVYFQPPSNIQMQYPCIVYKREFVNTEFADNTPYNTHKRYMVEHIGDDPDSDTPDKLAKLPMSTFSRFFTVANLNHDVYSIYF